MPEMPTKTTYNIETGETTIEYLTTDEVLAIETSEAEAIAAKEAEEALRASALAKLSAIGLTEEEIRSILG